MKRKKFLIAALVLVVAAVVAAFSFRKETDLSGSLPVDMVNEHNQPVAFSDLKGKVLFVNNWASWCPPCIAEMPSIMELKRKLQGVDIEFVMVSFDEDKSKAQAFMDKRKYDFKIYFPGQQYPFVTSSIPATFVVDKTGKTVMEHTGMTDYSSDEIVNQLKALANE
jgi:thiol-disulfide isomerase/thioredoxin